MLFGQLGLWDREETIEENRKLVEFLFAEIKKINPYIHIIITLLPRYGMTEKAMIPHMVDWKKEFEEIIKELNAIFSVTFLDYKDKSEIYSNKLFYSDFAHLNTRGAMCMSSILDDDLKRLGLYTI